MNLEIFHSCLLHRKSSSKLMFYLQFAIFLFFTVASVDSFRILLLPVQLQSHSACMSTIALELSARGHEVHIVFADGSPLPSDLQSSTSGVQVERYERRSLDGSPVPQFSEIFDNMTRMVLLDGANPKMIRHYGVPFAHDECRRFLFHNEPLLVRLEHLNFDMIVLDGVHIGRCLHLVPHRLGLPWATLTDTLEPWLVRVPWLPSFVSGEFAQFTEKMTFFERLQNTLVSFLLVSFPVIPDPPEDILSKYRAYGHFDTISDIASKSLLWIVSSDANLDYARPTMPNLIEAPGLTTKPSTGKLPPAIRNFVEISEKGIILVSFGSMSFLFPPDITQKFISAFSKLQGYKIIWRFKNGKGIQLTENILTLDWIPQNELLGHPMTKLFITHCGNNGQYESLYHGVPMIGFPLHGDQPYNAKRIVYKGYGLRMNIQDFTSDELLSNINTILADDKYKKSIAKASEIYKSSPQKPGEKAAWWIEHVTKFGGRHLRSAGNDLPLYQFLLLDVLAVLVGFVLLIVTCVWKAVRMFLKNALTRNEIRLKKKVL